MVPTSYKDLLKPEAKDKLAMPSPLTSGAATIHMAAITSDPALGWDLYEGLAEQGANPQGGNGGTYKAIAGGEKLYGFVVDFLPIRNKLDGAPVEFVFPEEGVSAGSHPLNRAEPGGRESLCRFPDLAPGSAVGCRHGLLAGAS